MKYFILICLISLSFVGCSKSSNENSILTSHESITNTPTTYEEPKNINGVWLNKKYKMATIDGSNFNGSYKFLVYYEYNFEDNTLTRSKGYQSDVDVYKLKPDNDDDKLTGNWELIELVDKYDIKNIIISKKESMYTTNQFSSEKSFFHESESRLAFFDIHNPDDEKTSWNNEIGAFLGSQRNYFFYENGTKMIIRQNHIKERPILSDIDEDYILKKVRR